MLVFRKILRMYLMDGPLPDKKMDRHCELTEMSFIKQLLEGSYLQYFVIWSYTSNVSASVLVITETTIGKFSK